MATFYKYAERNAQSQINWAEVGRNITDTLKEEARLREEKIAAIDENTRQLGLTLQDNPQGEHEGLNQWSLDYASNAQQMRLIQDRLLKSGQLNVRDYTKMRQNLSDGTDGIFAALEEYQTEYADKMERWREGESQLIEVELMKQAEGLANFAEYKPVIDSMSSEVFIAKMKDGKIDENPNNYLSVSSLRNRIKGKFDRFKTDEYAEKVATGFGVEIIEVAKRAGTTWGKVLTEESARGTLSDSDKLSIENYRTAEDYAISSAFTNPYNLTSILTENGYGFTWNATEAQNNDKLILLKNDPKNGYPVPDTGAKHYTKQKEAANELLRSIIRSKIDMKKEVQTFSITQPASRQPIQKSQGETTAETNTSMIGRLYTGRNDLQTALDYFRGRLPDGATIARDGNGIKITYANGTSKTIGFKNTDGSRRTQSQFIEAASSALLSEDDSANVIGLVGRAGVSQGSFDPNSTGFATVEKPKTSIDNFNQKVDALQLKSGDKYPEEEDLTERLNNEFANSGFTFDWRMDFGEAIDVKAPNNKRMKFNIDDAGMRNMKQFIKTNMKASLIDENTQAQASGYLGTIVDYGGK